MARLRERDEWRLRSRPGRIFMNRRRDALDGRIRARVEARTNIDRGEKTYEKDGVEQKLL